MTKKILGAVALSTLSIGLFTGCQSITDQIAQKAAQSMMNQASGGKVSFNSTNNGITIKDNQGNVANIGGGNQRPASAPSDLPNLPNATNFSWFGSNQGGIFGFTVNTTDYKTACTQIEALVQAAGWAVNPKGFNMEMNGTIATEYQKTGYDLVLSCSNKDSSSSIITLTKSSNTDSSSSTSTSTTTTTTAPSN